MTAAVRTTTVHGVRVTWAFDAAARNLRFDFALADFGRPAADVAKLDAAVTDYVHAFLEGHPGWRAHGQGLDDLFGLGPEPDPDEDWNDGGEPD